MCTCTCTCTMYKGMYMYFVQGCVHVLCIRVCTCTHIQVHVLRRLTNFSYSIFKENSLFFFISLSTDKLKHVNTWCIPDMGRCTLYMYIPDMGPCTLVLVHVHTIYGAMYIVHVLSLYLVYFVLYMHPTKCTCIWLYAYKIVIHHLLFLKLVVEC